MESASFVYIDHTKIIGKSLEFVEKLSARILRINSDIKVLSYIDIHDKNKADNWLPNTIDAISKSIITIAIVDNDYLNQIEKNDSLKEEIEKIQSSTNRYFFPIIYGTTNWLNANWLVKSKLYPSNGSIDKLEPNQQEEEINTIALKIETILNINTNIKESSKSQKTNIKKVLSNKSVFISHSSKDADFAELLQLKLEKSDISSWLDNERLKIGQDWREEIDEGIKESIAVIVIMTPNAKESEYVTYEWAYAWGNDKVIFPIMLEQTQLHPRLESLQYLNFSNRTSRPWDELIESIKKLKT